jgi:cob(I)alamin adenosyltransferase
MRKTAKENNYDRIVNHSKTITSLQMAKALPSVTTWAGDKGTTGLGFGGRIRKDVPIIDLLGTLDELSATLGILLNHVNADVQEKIRNIQVYLLDLGGCIAMNRGPTEPLKGLAEELEDWGLELEKTVPEFDCFILPGGHESAAFAHLARTIARRAERRAVTVFADAADGDWILKILNRLSDVLFLLGRYQNIINQTPEIKYKSSR